MLLEAEVRQVESPPAYQQVAPRALVLHRLGLSDAGIGRLLGVTDKTVGKTSSGTWNSVDRARGESRRPKAPVTVVHFDAPRLRQAHLLESRAARLSTQSRSLADGILGTHRLRPRYV